MTLRSRPAKHRGVDLKHHCPQKATPALFTGALWPFLCSQRCRPVRLFGSLLTVLVALASGTIPAVSKSATCTGFRIPVVELPDTVFGVACTGFRLVRPRRPRVAVALSGGGVRGLAQIGVLKALEEAGVPVDIVVGTSMGAIIGGLYASGFSPDELWALASSIQWSDILSDKPRRTQLFLGQKQERERHIVQLRLEQGSLRPDIPLAYSPGQRLSLTLASLVLRAPFGTLKSFAQLPRPLYVLATDLIEGKMVVIRSGDLAEAMRASASIPLLFSPVEWNGSLLVDGGLVSNIPVEQARRAGADIVIAVDTTSPLRRPEELDLPWEVADQVTTIMQLQRNEQELALADVAVRIPLPDQSAVEFRNLEEIFHAGYQAGKSVTEQVLSILESRQDSLILSIWGLPPDSTLCTVHSESQGCTWDHADLRSHPTVREVFQYLARQIEGSAREASFAAHRDTLFIWCDPAPAVDSLHILSDPQLDSVLAPIAASWKPRPLAFRSFANLITQIHDTLRAKGLALAKVDQAIYQPATRTLVLRVQPGRIRSVRIEGAKRTRPLVVLREFPLRAGDIFQARSAIEGLENVYSTGLFDWVGLSFRERTDGYELTLRVIERSPRILRFGARYDLERRGKVFAEYSDENLLGGGNTLSITGVYGVRDQGLLVAYRADRILRTYLTASVEAYRTTGRWFTYEGNRRVGEYRRTQSCLRLSFGQQMRRLGTIWLSIRWENIDLDRIYGSGYPTGDYDFRTFGLRSVVDTRDKVPFARSGKHHEWYYEYSSGRFLTSDISYTKLASSLETFTSRGRHTFHPRLAWGTSDLTTPFPVQYTLGGLDSFFGLVEEQKRGRHFLRASFEYRFALPWGLWADWYTGIRVDWGAIWENNSSVKSKDLFYGVGAYLAADTVLGPMVLAYGRTQWGSSAIYVSLGRQF